MRLFPPGVDRSIVQLIGRRLFRVRAMLSGAPSATLLPLTVTLTTSAVNCWASAPDQILLKKSSRLAKASLRFDDAEPWRVRSLSTSSLGELKQTARAGTTFGEP